MYENCVIRKMKKENVKKQQKKNKEKQFVKDLYIFANTYIELRIIKKINYF